MIPDNIIEGKKTTWLYIVSFAWFLTANPSTHEIASDTITNKAKDHVFEKADRFTERQKEKEAQVAKTEKVGKEQPDQKPKTKKHDMEL